MSDGGRSRRELLTSWLRPLKDAAHRSSHRRRTDMLRPPGAIVPDERFIAACTACGNCIDACPWDAITLIDHEGVKLPGIDPSTQPCRLCQDLPCISSCPDGALESPGEPEDVRLGVAVVDPRLCVTFHGQPCDRCFRACPYPDRAITMVGGRPLVGRADCTGCGLCEKACPEEPRAIVVVAERLLVPGLRIPPDPRERR